MGFAINMSCIICNNNEHAKWLEELPQVGRPGGAESRGGMSDGHGTEGLEVVDYAPSGRTGLRLSGGGHCARRYPMDDRAWDYLNQAAKRGMGARNTSKALLFGHVSCRE